MVNVNVALGETAKAEPNDLRVTTVLTVVINPIHVSGEHVDGYIGRRTNIHAGYNCPILAVHESFLNDRIVGVQIRPVYVPVVSVCMHTNIQHLNLGKQMVQAAKLPATYILN